MANSSDEVRKAYIDFFAERDHEVVASGSLIPANDPSLLFVNAGMVPFKDVFTGKERRPYTRATSSQKVIRIAGKHNDLENVGPSPRHHTFFEMLGNFSFGDYFKEEAIVYAHEFLTKVLQLDTKRMIFTYFAGEDGIEPDYAARDLWKKVTGYGDDQIIGLGKSENFWSMGDTGPCGPCSEIHYYNGKTVDRSCFGEEQTPEGVGWMEIWNLVFMQFERAQSGDMTSLPAPSIDTGMGLERVASVVQGKLSNYDTDLLSALTHKTAGIAHKKYGGTMQPDDVSMRVVADHARLCAFSLAEGIMPDRTGREYVLRRVMRRAIRHGHRLGIERPFLHEVALEVVQMMKHQYPELGERADFIASVTEQEEVRFRQTIERGLGLLDERFAELEKAKTRQLSGPDAFKLYDTYGFPVDLTEVICAERGYHVDMPGYEVAMEEARKRSEFTGVETAVEGVYREALARVPAGQVQFTGYDSLSGEAEVLALIVDGKLVDMAKPGTDAAVVVASTPFYGEAGGQVGDQGVIRAGDAVLNVADVQKPVTGLVVHQGPLSGGTLSVGQRVELVVDPDARAATARNHSATHLLHWALRQVLGAHAQQKGSQVGPDRLRFDFTHGSALSAEQIRQIEDLVNARVLKNLPVGTDVLTMSEARQRGAMMIFEEKYGDTVRMLSMGESVELCGGTHVHATGDIGLVKVVSEQGVAAGVRRIIATSGAPSLAYVRELEDVIARAARTAKASGGDLAEKVEKLVAREKQLEKQVTELQRKLATGAGTGGVSGMLERARDIAGVKVLGVRTDVTDRAALRELAEQLRDSLGNSVVLVASESDGKAQLVLTVSKALNGRYKAGQIIGAIAKVVGGSGGGRPDMAQAGGTDVQHLDDAVEAVYAAVGAVN